MTTAGGTARKTQRTDAGPRRLRLQVDYQLAYFSMSSSETSSFE
jgi:hypothetical protein